jgi:CBS domain-containing membrane protein
MKRQNAIERLQELTVADVMNKQVITVGAHQAMAQVAQVFLRHEISAAPVIDESGRFVGMLSATDFLRRDAQTLEPRLGLADHGQALVIRDCGPDMACAYMTTAVQTASPRTPLIQAAMMMTAVHIHRLPVLDAEQRLIGMMSTMDVTAALVNIVDQWHAHVAVPS